jgi:hypothetical protein
MQPNRLAGHYMLREGRLNYGMDGWPNGPGSVPCACGEKSPVLPTTAARKRWHGEHKDAVRARQAVE